MHPAPVVRASNVAGEGTRAPVTLPPRLGVQDDDTMRALVEAIAFFAGPDAGAELVREALLSVGKVWNAAAARALVEGPLREVTAHELGPAVADAIVESLEPMLRGLARLERRSVQPLSLPSRIVPPPSVRAPALRVLVVTGDFRASSALRVELKDLEVFAYGSLVDAQRAAADEPVLLVIDCRKRPPPAAKAQGLARAAIVLWGATPEAHAEFRRACPVSLVVARAQASASYADLAGTLASLRELISA